MPVVSLPHALVDQLNREYNGYGDAVGGILKNGYIARQSWENVQPGAAASILADTPLTEEPQTLTTGFNQPDCPRALVYTGATETGPVVVTGYDVDGGLMTETVTADGPGTMPFARIESIQLAVGAPDLPEGNGARSEKSDRPERLDRSERQEKAGGKVTPRVVGSVSIGTNNQFGLDYSLTDDTLLLATENGEKVALPTVVRIPGTMGSRMVEFTPTAGAVYRLRYIAESG